MTQDVMDYFNEAWDYIQENSIKREQIDWQTLREEVFALVEKAQTPAETYPVIRMVLERLGDNHSFFRDPEEERIVKEGMAHDFGLRVVYPEGIIVLIFPGSPAEKSGLRVGDCIIQINGQPIGIITPKDRRLAFRAAQLDLAIVPAGREITRLVQLQSALYSVGLPTGNAGKQLRDGAMVVLTRVLGADRMGRTYDSPLLPDYPVKTNWTQLGTVDDPVLQAAVQWLQAEEGCI